LCVSGAYWSGGCETPWNRAGDTPGYQWDGRPSQAVIDDVQSFIRSNKIPQQDLENTEYHEDYKTGKIAAVVDVVNHYSWWDRKEYILYYDTNSIRTEVKTIRYNHNPYH
jgi:hypothetical protein